MDEIEMVKCKKCNNEWGILCLITLVASFFFGWAFGLSGILT